MKIEPNALPKDLPVREMSPAESTALWASLHLAMNRPADARALIGETRKIDGANAASYEVEAMLLDRAGQRTEAVAAFAKAAELNSENFYTYYRLSTLARDDERRKQAQDLINLLERPGN